MPEANEAQPDSPQPGTQPRRSLVLAMLGWRRRPGKRIPARPTAWGVVLLAVVVFLGGGIAFAEYSMQPDFCRSCHIMEPYYQAWHQSTHRDIPCGDCHFEPGWRHTLKGKFEASSQAVKYITNTYGSKPHAEVRDSSCLRSGCHGERLLEGSVEWEVTSSLGHMVTIRFDHTPHLEELRRGKELRCVSCHSQMVQGKHITVTLDTCFVCHFKGQAHGRDEDVLGGCESCHSAPKPEIRLSTGLFNHADYVGRGVACVNCHSDSIKGDGEVPKQVCWNCHNQATQVARHGEPALIHQVHVTDNKVECSSCHVQIEHNLTAGVPREHRVLGTGLMLDHGGACGQCHESTHAGPDELYRGTGGRGVPDMPSPMYRAQVDCIACHRESGRPLEEASVSGQTYLAAQDSCDYCHGERYRTVLDEWKEALEERILEAEVAYEGARRSSEAAAELDPQTSLEIRRLLDDASHNIRFIRLSHGVHNMNYSMALLSRARENCDEVGTRIEAVTESR